MKNLKDILRRIRVTKKNAYSVVGRGHTLEEGKEMGATRFLKIKTSWSDFFIFYLPLRKKQK